MNQKTPAKTSEKASVTGQSSGIYPQSIAAIRFLVSGKISERELPAKEDKPARTLYSQQAVIIGSSREMPYSITTFDDNKAVYAEGVYMLSKDSLRIGRYDRLEINTYEPMIFVRQLNEQEKMKFEAAVTSMDDFA